MTRQQRQRQSLRVREKSTCGRENAKCRKKDGGYLSLKETQPSKLNLKISTYTHTQSRLGDGMGDWERHNRERGDGRGKEWELRVGLVGGQEGRKEERGRQAGRQGRLVVIDKALLLMTFSMRSVVRWPLPSPGADSSLPRVNGRHLRCFLPLLPYLGMQQHRLRIWVHQFLTNQSPTHLPQVLFGTVRGEPVFISVTAATWFCEKSGWIGKVGDVKLVLLKPRKR